MHLVVVLLKFLASTCSIRSTDPFVNCEHPRSGLLKQHGGHGKLN